MPESCPQAFRADRWREAVMSEQVKTIVAYVVGVSVLLLAWSFFKTWEPPLPVVSGTAIAIPHRTGGLPPVPVSRD
jgi:hypothetical protein